MADDASPPNDIPGTLIDPRLRAIPPGSTVAVAMSGGVDSSVAAALCQRAGHRVFGLMLRLWAEPGAESANKCCTRGAIDDARAVASRLGIPFTVLDAREAFRQAVVEPFLEASAQGDTPNPCFGCNRNMRFEYLLGRARALGADYLATGHYARVVGQGAQGADAGFRLLRGVDETKDQSYMLHRLDQPRLARALFPLGGLRKAEVRELAERIGLSVAARPDSVDLCFTARDGVFGFLSRHLPADDLAPGPILDRAGKALGEHRGLPLYTLGQRRGLGVAQGEPVYVVSRDRERNALVVGAAEGLMASRIEIDEAHWISGRPPGAPIDVIARIRYRDPGTPARLSPSADGLGAALAFESPVRAPTRGQGMVAYLGDEVVCGGRIAIVEGEER